MHLSQPSEIQLIQQALQTAWCRATSADPAWSPERPSLGQCAVTALVVQDYLGGILMRAEVADGSHYWNRLPDGTELDLTSDQFDEFTPRCVEPKDRAQVLAYPATRARYEALQTAVRRKLKRGKVCVP